VIQAEIDQVMTQWMADLDSVTRQGVGTFFGVIVVLDRLTENYDLDDPSLFTRGGGRIAGQNPAKIAKILERVCPDSRIETTSIGGRTSPGPANAARSLIRHLRQLNLVDEKSRQEVLDHCVRFCLGQVLTLQAQEKIKFDFDASKPLQYAFAVLLDKYVATVKGRALTQHLVGAKLELRFEEFDIRIDRSSVDSRDVDKVGDFEVNDYVFHVSVSPNLGHIEKCVLNIQRHGKRPVLLVPSTKTSAARTLAETKTEGDRIDIKSIEGFLSQNVEELARFGVPLVEARLVDLLKRYNDRIGVAEPGKPYLEIEWSGLHGVTE